MGWLYNLYHWVLCGGGGEVEHGGVWRDCVLCSLPVLSIYSCTQAKGYRHKGKAEETSS